MLMIIGALLAVIAAVWAYRRFVPVRGLRRMDYSDLKRAALSTEDVQMLDVRDYLEYEEGHHPDAVNLSIGRLSSFWMRHLVSNRPLVLIGARRSEVYSASRFLRKKGFHSISFALYEKDQQPNMTCCAKCYC